MSTITARIPDDLNEALSKVAKVYDRVESYLAQSPREFFLQSDALCESYQHIIQLFIAFGTILSCVISLYLSSRSQKIIIKGELFIGKEVGGSLLRVENTELPKIWLEDNTLIVATISNLNLFPIYLINSIYELKFCGLKLPLLELGFEARKRNKEAKFPYVINANDQASFKCKLSILRDFFDIYKQNHKFDLAILRLISFFKLDYICCYGCYLFLGTGEQKKIKVSTGIRRVIRKLLRD